MDDKKISHIVIFFLIFFLNILVVSSIRQQLKLNWSGLNHVKYYFSILWCDFEWKHPAAITIVYLRHGYSINQRFQGSSKQNSAYVEIFLAYLMATLQADPYGGF